VIFTLPVLVGVNAQFDGGSSDAHHHQIHARGAGGAVIDVIVR